MEQRLRNERCLRQGQFEQSFAGAGTVCDSWAKHLTVSPTSCLSAVHTEVWSPSTLRTP